MFRSFVLLALSCSISAGQPPDKAKPTLDLVIRELYSAMASENKEAQVAALQKVFPRKKDVETLFPKHADKLWPKFEEGFKLMAANNGAIAKEMRRGGAVKSIEPIDVRTDNVQRYKKVLAIIPKEIPVYRYLIEQEKGSGAGGTYLFVNHRWIWIRGLEAIPLD